MPDEPGAERGALRDPWEGLRRLTGARIALGHAGPALPTAAHLELQLAHARARDAVHEALDTEGVAAALAEASGQPVLHAHGAAPDRATYLLRPDLGRRLDDASRERLANHREATRRAASPDLAIVVADGLSARAVHRHAASVVARLAARLRDDAEPWSIAPVVLVAQGRVAIGDEIGELLAASLVVVLLGERPGLSAPDSLGAYLTWAPRAGRTDAERNCVSNIRAEGLEPAHAAHTIAWLAREARRRRLTGTALRDEAPLARGAEPARIRGA